MSEPQGRMKRAAKQAKMASEPAQKHMSEHPKWSRVILAKLIFGLFWTQFEATFGYFGVPKAQTATIILWAASEGSNRIKTAQICLLGHSKGPKTASGESRVCLFIGGNHAGGA